MSLSTSDRILRLGVPLEHGGAGGSARDAAEALASLARSDAAQAAKFWAQRLLVECLLHSFNVGLRDYHLPALLERSIDGTAALGPRMHGPEPVTVAATDTHRGWRLSGRLPAPPNLESGWWIAAVPIAAPGGNTYVVGLVSSEHDGVTRADNGRTLQLERVHFREDELIAVDGPALVASVRTVALALHGLSLPAQAPRAA